MGNSRPAAASFIDLTCGPQDARRRIQDFASQDVLRFVPTYTAAVIATEEGMIAQGRGPLCCEDRGVTAPLPSERPSENSVWTGER